MSSSASHGNGHEFAVLSRLLSASSRTAKCHEPLIGESKLVILLAFFCQVSQASFPLTENSIMIPRLSHCCPCLVRWTTVQRVIARPPRTRDDGSISPTKAMTFRVTRPPPSPPFWSSSSVISFDHSFLRSACVPPTRRRFPKNIRPLPQLALLGFRRNVNPLGVVTDSTQ